MELLQLRYFCSAAETENFSRTARKFIVPPSDISQSIHRLEKELGTKLFVRTANSVTLNEQGRLFYEDVSRALDLVETAKKRLLDMEEVGGEVRILVLTNRKLVASTIEKFKKEYKNVHFKMMHSQGESDDGPYDLVVSDEPCDGKNSKALFVREAFGIAMRRDHPLADTEPLRLSDLKDGQFISMHEGSSLHRFARKLCREAGFEPNIVIQTDDPFYVRKCVELGLGVAVTPLTSWEGQFGEEVLCRPIDGTYRDTYVWWDSGRYMPQAVRLFLACMTAGTI